MTKAAITFFRLRTNNENLDDVLQEKMTGSLELPLGRWQTEIAYSSAYIPTRIINIKHGLLKTDEEIQLIVECPLDKFVNGSIQPGRGLKVEAKEDSNVATNRYRGVISAKAKDNVPITTTLALSYELRSNKDSDKQSEAREFEVIILTLTFTEFDIERDSCEFGSGDISLD
jgi:hypothetical protein